MAAETCATRHILGSSEDVGNRQSDTDMTHPTPEHIVKLLHQADGEFAKGHSVDDVCRRKHISTATYFDNVTLNTCSMI